jgi:hypothetical protein
MTTSLLGIDPGFGNFKIATANGSACIASIVGPGRDTDLGLLGAGMHGRRDKIPVTVTFTGDGGDTLSCLVGENVTQYVRAPERMDLNRLGESIEVRALLYAALHEVLGEGTHTAKAVVGLPVEVMADKSVAKSILRALCGWLVDEHAFAVDGDAGLVSIEDVKILPQPAGAFFDTFIDDRGNVLDPDDLKRPIAICDIGFNTLDLFAQEGASPILRYTDGESLGMRRACEVLAATAKQRFGVSLSLHEADALLRDRDPLLYTIDGDIPLADAASQARASCAAGIIRFIEERWGNARQFSHVLFTGGGVAALESELQEQYPRATFVADPVMANARGLCKYARRSWK